MDLPPEYERVWGQSMPSPASSGWTGSTAVDTAQQDCLVTAASCGCIQSVAFYLLCHVIYSLFIFLSFFFFFSLHCVFLTLTLRERETFLSFQGAGGLCPLCLFLCLLLPLLEIHCVSCSPGVTNKISKTYSTPGKGEAYGLYIEADPEVESNGSHLKGPVGLSFLPKGKKATEWMHVQRAVLGEQYSWAVQENTARWSRHVQRNTALDKTSLAGCRFSNAQVACNTNYFATTTSSYLWYACMLTYSNMCRGMCFSFCCCWLTQYLKLSLSLSCYCFILQVSSTMIWRKAISLQYSLSEFSISCIAALLH